MGLFDLLFGATEAQKPLQKIQPIESKEVSPANVGALNLTKGSVLNLNKTDANLSSLRLAAGWDVPTVGRAYDLDLAAYLLDDSGKVVNMVNFSKQHVPGLSLDGDNLTGEGDGDDENIYIDLHKISPKVVRIVLADVIYLGRRRNQSMGQVKNAYMRLVDETTKKEVLRYNLSNDGGDHTAVIFAELFKENNAWSFKALGQGVDGSIDDVARML